MFIYKNQFLLIFSFLSIPIELWESTAATCRQSAGYVLYFKRFDYFPFFFAMYKCWMLITQRILSFWDVTSFIVDRVSYSFVY